MIRDSERGWKHFVGAKQTPPLFVDDAQTVAIALYHPRDPEYLLVLDEDLAQLERADLTPAQLRDRYQGAQAKQAEQAEQAEQAAAAPYPADPHNR
ncbi:hypothetical protein ENSA5_62120 [Enhygromyxa salina]|uniref:Uncharacterized protein n=1 Tax=Enhygromyxa salina TaxID=215803 RepID=A0A2S9XD32_9BACT|nr:hypothetical protein [Enhygromyxa salina]PRP90778.1 hypothetical protein ENSA5_62120 [Enhygromyxa salina]